MLYPLLLSLALLLQPPTPTALPDLLRGAADEADRMQHENARLKHENRQLQAKMRRPAAEEPPFSLGPAGTTAPATVHVHAVGLVAEDPHLAGYAWDFGDPGGAYNRVSGFNAAHVYDRPGTYTITLTLTEPGRKPRTLTREITVATDDRPVTFVAAGGDDRNDGAHPDRPLATLGAAVDAAGRKGLIAFRRGDTFRFDRPVRLASADLALTTYGDADAPPTLHWTGPGETTQVLEFPAGGGNLRLDGLRFTTDHAGETDKFRRPTSMHPAGRNLTIRGCRFEGWQDVVNADAHPAGVLVQDAAVETETGLAGYFLWGDGTDLVLLGNDVPNSTVEHAVRVGGGAERVLLWGNRLGNLDRRAVEQQDYAKAAVNFQLGRYGWAEANTIDGPAAIGPLGGGDGRPGSGERFRFAVLRDNRLASPDTRYALWLHHGAQDVLVEGNRIAADGRHAIYVEGFDAKYGRGVERVALRRNTVTNGGKLGTFLRGYGPVEDVTVVGNTYVAPNLTPGPHEAAAVTLTTRDPSGYRFDANTWPDAGPRSGWVEGGLNYSFTHWSDPAGYKTLDEWNALPFVGTDRVADPE